MLAYVVAIILGVFVFADVKSRCFKRHAFVCALIPVCLSLWNAALALIGLKISISIYLIAIDLDLLALGGAGLGMYLARKLGDKLAPRYAAYWESLA